jgi:hypothetical protein
MRAFLATCILMLCLASPALAHHKPGHNGGGPNNTSTQPTATEAQPATQPARAGQDRCSNIDGTQQRVPTGYGEQDGQCTPYNGDWCSNFEGRQTSVPATYTVNDRGECVRDEQPAPQQDPDPTPQAPDPQTVPDPDPVEQPDQTTPGDTDVCPNLDGNQARVPSGYSYNGSSCVRQGADVCENLDGKQTSVPDGYEADGSDCRKQIDCDKGEQEKDGKCVRPSLGLNFISPSMPLVAPKAGGSGDDLGSVELDETLPKKLATGKAPDVDNPVFPWLPLWALALITLVPLALALLLMYLAVHRPRRIAARQAAVPAAAAVAAPVAEPVAEPAVTEPIIVPAEIDEADLIPPDADGTAQPTQPMPAVDPDEDLK